MKRKTGDDIGYIFLCFVIAAVTTFLTVKGMQIGAAVGEELSRYLLK